MNNDIYAEWLVKRKKSPYRIPFLIGMTFLIIIGLYLSMINPFGFIALLLFAGLTYFGNMRFHVEYEYIFVTNELAIDRILSQRVRKNVQKIQMQKVEKIAPMSSHEFDYVKNGGNQTKVVDYSSGKADAVTYGIAYSDEKGRYVFVIEPNANLLKCLKNSAPRKVILEQSITAK